MSVCSTINRSSPGRMLMHEHTQSTKYIQKPHLKPTNKKTYKIHAKKLYKKIYKKYTKKPYKKYIDLRQITCKQNTKKHNRGRTQHTRNDHDTRKKSCLTDENNI